MISNSDCCMDPFRSSFPKHPRHKSNELTQEDREILGTALKSRFSRCSTDLELGISSNFKESRGSKIDAAMKSRLKIDRRMVDLLCFFFFR